MAEPELEPPVPAEHFPPLLRRGRGRLFRRRKIPAWIAIVYVVVTEVPHWKHRIDFWLGTVVAMGGLLSHVAAVFAWPYFSYVLLFAGFAYLIFVGEPARGVQRHPWWPYLAGSVFSLCVTAMVVTAGWGAIQVYIQREISHRDAEIQQRALGTPVFWHLSDYSRNTLKFELDKVPTDDRFPVQIKCLPDSISRTFVNDIGQIFLDEQWKLTTNCLSSNVRPDLLGIYISVAKSITRAEDAPPNARKLANILGVTGILFEWSADASTKDGEFFLVIGNGPKPP